MFFSDVFLSNRRPRRTFSPLFLFTACLLSLLPGWSVTAHSEVCWQNNVLSIVQEGRVLWRDRSPVALFRPVVSNRWIWVTGHTGQLRALDRHTGRLVWTLDTGDDWIYPPLFAQGTVVAVGRHSGLWGLEADSGKVRWHRSLQAEPVQPPLQAGTQRGLLALFDGHLLLFSVTDGRLIWRRQLKTPALEPAVGKDQVVVGGYAPRLRALALADGHLLWRRPLPARLSRPVRFTQRGLEVFTDEFPPLVLDRRTGRCQTPSRATTPDTAPFCGALTSK